LHQTPTQAELSQLDALLGTGRYAELENRARSLLGQYPNAGLVWEKYGISLQMQGKYSLQAFQRTAELMPNDAGAQYNLGHVLKSLGQLNDAAASYRRAAKIKPDFTEAYINLGNVLQALGQIDDAVTSYRGALKIKPGAAEAHNNLGIALMDARQIEEALASFLQAVKIRPNHADAHYNLGNAYKELGQFEAAVENYRLALKFKPDFAAAYSNLGNVLRDIGQYDDALDNFRRALELNPGSAEAHNNLGAILQGLKRLHEAAASYRRALEIDPNYAKAHNNLGAVMQDLGRHDVAEASYRRALEVKPDYFQAHDNLLFSLNYSTRPPDYCLEEARRYGRMVSGKVTSRFTSWQCADSPVRLRVGVVSGDLCNHPVGYALKSLLEQLDLARVELIAYPTDPVSDEFTAQIKPYFVSWKPVYGLGDEEVARLIHGDGVHVLLDLSGHTEKNRLPVFAWKPAPVQASWLGYFATTGMAEMDYLLTSEAAVPKEHQWQYTEVIWYLPDTWLCFSAPETNLSVSSLPALQNGYITFGCFQRHDKLGKEVLPAWSRILTALPDARLRMASKHLGDAAVKAQFVDKLQQHGIDPARVAMSGPASSRETYLARYAEVDVMLDTFPYPGVTTTCEALWMGVPTITLAGDTLLARQGAGVLTAAGLKNWIATGTDDYVEKAVTIAGDTSGLSELRAGLRGLVEASPLFDAPRFAKHFEKALWDMWNACSRIHSHTKI
jgi:protein O-GlcNAc transferase